MNLLINKIHAVALDDTCFMRVLSLYPEEELSKRKVFAEAIAHGEIEYNLLLEESGKVLLPWQIFFLSPEKLEVELVRIESLRQKAVSSRVAKRAGIGKLTSRRILDRLIRCQAYISSNHNLPQNTFCGSLSHISKAEDAVASICQQFDIRLSSFRSKNKEDALAYLIERFERRQINVCQGVLTNKILPLINESRSVYKNTSGFVIHGESLPFLFLPSEVNKDEKIGRQIFTLVYLIALIGLDAYNYQIDPDFKVKMLGAKGKEKLAYRIVSEFLLPNSATQRLLLTPISVDVRDTLAKDYKITPTAVVVILFLRGIISAPEYKMLLPKPVLPIKTKGGAPVPIESSVRKFNGKYACEIINSDFSSGRLKPIQLQHLLFGSINKSGFKKYKHNLGL